MLLRLEAQAELIGELIGRRPSLETKAPELQWLMYRLMREVHPNVHVLRSLCHQSRCWFAQCRLPVLSSYGCLSRYSIRL